MCAGVNVSGNTDSCAAPCLREDTGQQRQLCGAMRPQGHGAAEVGVRPHAPARTKGGGDSCAAPCACKGIGQQGQLCGTMCIRGHGAARTRGGELQ